MRQITIFVTPSVTAPNIDRFTVEPAQISVGQCVTLRWEVSGNVSRVVISRDGTPLWDGAPVTGSMQDCPPGEGRRGYVIEATGSGGTSRRQRDVTVVVPYPSTNRSTAHAHASYYSYGHAGAARHHFFQRQSAANSGGRLREYQLGHRRRHNVHPLIEKWQRHYG
ncbi:MAG: hypothetical protein M5U34_39070 [Chloroflexi bacterium]|nr:hypothetical protein [Chloroflexota bacterium]